MDHLEERKGLSTKLRERAKEVSNIEKKKKVSTMSKGNGFAKPDIQGQNLRKRAGYMLNGKNFRTNEAINASTRKKGGKGATEKKRTVRIRK